MNVLLQIIFKQLWLFSYIIVGNDKTRQSCFLNPQLMEPVKNWKRYPPLDFLLSLSSVHSTPANPINVEVSFYRPCNYFPFVALLKYEATLFASSLLLFYNSRFLSLFNMQSIFSSIAFFHLSLSCRHKSCFLFLDSSFVSCSYSPFCLFGSFGYWTLRLIF